MGLTVVAGAPRANHSGAVVLLKKESNASSKLLVEHTFYGPALASSFGYDVAVVDLDSDGWETHSLTLKLSNIPTTNTHDTITCARLWSRWQDIVVGAPQFYMKDGDVGGAVYVYKNQEGRWDGVTPVRLDGTKDSMFGLAVENIGDVNQDSFEGN